MPFIAFKRQSGADTQCPSGFSFYTCNTAQVIWRGCCSLDPCTTGCPDDSQPSTATTSATQSLPTSTDSITSVSTSRDTSTLEVVAESTAAAASTGVLTPPSDAETTLSSLPSPTSLGESPVPTGVSEDPSTQTLTTFVDSGSDSSLSTSDKSDVPAIIGATIGALVLAALISLLFFCYRRRKFRASQRRRHEAIPFKPEKREMDDTTSESPGLHLTRVHPRSQSRPRVKKRDSSPYANAAQPTPFPDTVPVLDSKSIPVLNELPAITSNHPPSSSYELASNPISPNQSKITSQDNQDSRMSYNTTSNRSNTDPTSWTQPSNPTATDGCQSQMVTSLTANNTPKSLSETFPGTVLSNQMDSKPKPGLENPHRISRATGATFTPAKGATVAPSIKITPAQSAQG